MRIERNRFIGLISGILPFFAAMLLQYSLMVLLEIGFRGTYGLHGQDTIPSYTLGVIAVFLCGLFFFFFYRDTVRYHKLTIPRQVFRVKSILLLICLGVAVQFAISGMMSLLQSLLHQLFRDYQEVIDSILGHNPLVVFLYVIIIAPITEELIFRGVMLAKLKEAIPFYGANLIQAATFGIYHWNIIQGIYAFGIGLLFGYITQRFRSLTAAVILHMAVNGAAFLVVLLPKNRLLLLLSTLGGVLALVVILYGILRRTEKSSDNVS